MKHTYLFARQEGMHGITTVAILVLNDLTKGNLSRPKEDVLKLFMAATTDWLNKTDEGKEAWAESVEDFNIGDFLIEEVHKTQAFMDLCQHYGFSVDMAEGLGMDMAVPYDRVLNLDPPDEDY